MASSKNMTIVIDPKEVVYTNISKSVNGYNSASIVSKKADGEYQNISYEWSNEVIPQFCMDLMEFMKSNNVEKSSVWPGMEAEFASYKESLSK